VLLDVTIPVDATIRLLLREVRRRGASNIGACTESYAHGYPPSAPSRLHVDGIRVMIQSGDFAGKSAQDFAEILLVPPNAKELMSESLAYTRAPADIAQR
jgi:hypothetical protein